MRICCIADTHYGARTNNANFYPKQKLFIENVLIPTLDKVKPDVFIHLGDLVDDRKSINQLTYKRCKEDFIDPVRNLCEMEDIDDIWIPGNHDAYYNNTLEPNAVDGIFNLHSVYHMHDDLVCVPWICQANREEIENYIKQTKARFCFGHFHLNGFKMDGSKVAANGDDPNLLSKFDLVLTGHFHTRQKQGNILYTGAAFEFNWNDFGEYKGLTIIDTETRSISSKKNPYHMFSVLKYDEDNLPDIESAKDTYCRLLILKSTNETRLRDFINQINDLGVIDLQVIEQPVELEGSDPLKTVSDDDLKKIFSKYVDSLDIQNKDGVESCFDEIYTEAQRK